MERYIGDNNFGPYFDFYKWSAPFFDTPQDVVRYVNSLKLKGKIVRRINVIGCGYDAGCANNGLLYEKLREAGLEPEYDDNDEDWYQWYNTYPNKDKILVPWSVQLCEPIQFVFEDGTTFEILPTESGGARIGVNSIPQTLSDGLNHSDFDANIFFEEVIGRTLKSFCMRVIETRKKYIDGNSVDREKPYIETREEYLFNISFDYPYEMTLSQTYGSWYWAELTGSGQDMSVPYARVEAAKKSQNEEQIMIVNGRDTGGTFWIVPISLDENLEKTNWLIDGYGISIYDIFVNEFLTEFLYKYFEPTVQKRGYAAKTFNWYGGNVYKFEAVRKMVEDIRTACWLLEHDYENTDLEKIKAHFSWHLYTSKHKDELTESELDELRRNRVPAAIDFYERFCSRMENMMLLPGKDAISFAGP